MEDEHTDYDEIEFTYSTADNHKISSICCPYFKIEGLSQEKLSEIIQLENREWKSMKEISNFLYPETDEIIRKANKKAIRTIISPNINGWTYIIWSLGRYEDCRELVRQISLHTNTRVSTFHVDPWSAYNYWVIAENGEIIREFEDHGGVEAHISKGTPVCNAEKYYLARMEKQRKRGFDAEQWATERTSYFSSVEDIYEEMVRATGQHVEILNKYISDDPSFVFGMVNVEECPVSSNQDNQKA